jgi:hypothetical protein
MTTCLSKDDAGAPICNRGKQQYGGADAAMGDRDQKKPYLAVTCHIRAEMRVPVYVTVATHARRTNDMINLPDGIVSVHLGNERYRGAYYFRGDKLVVTAYGMRESSADLEVLGGERGKAMVNLAKLVLIDMVRASQAMPDWHPELALCGTTTQIYY